METRVASLIDNQLAEVKKRLSGKKVDKLYMVGCGGGVAIFRHCEYLLRRQKPSFEFELIHAADLLVEKPNDMNENALVLCYSLNGTMKEVVEAMHWAKERGAYVIGITRTPDTPMSSEPDFSFMFYREMDQGHPYVNAGPVTLMLVACIMETLSGYPDLPRIQKAMAGLDEIFSKARRIYVEEKGSEFINRLANAKMVYTVGGGLNYTCAYVLATCYLLEMQWINASPLNAAEFFHGPLEIVDKDSTFVLMLSDSEYRPQEERVHAFLDRFTRGTFVLDAKDFMPEEMDEDLRGIVSFITVDTLIDDMVAILAEARYHPIDTRRYYLKMDY